MSSPVPIWLPSPWLYVRLGIKQFWSNLNVGDRLTALFALVLVAALPVSFIVRLGQMVASQSPQWAGLTIGASVFLLVCIGLTGSMVKVRSHPWFRYLPETKRRKIGRIIAEFLASCLVSLGILAIIIWFLPTSRRALLLGQALSIAVAGHMVVHLIQFCLRALPVITVNAAALTGMTDRNKIAPFLANTALAQLQGSSSLFMQKANSNPLIWVFVLLTIAALGGTAISLASPLLGLSSLSTLLLVFQLALMEPRVGNGRAIGAHSKKLPIKRARHDLLALSIPHLICLAAALPLVIYDTSAINAAIAGAQLLLTLWIIWIFLVVGALPAHKPAKSFFWFVGGALISSQLFPPLIVVWLIVITAMLTRDLMRLSLEGPASWPR
jgi:hypothetical protein